MNVCGNEIADELAREGSIKDANSDGCLTFLEIGSPVKQDINALWRVASVHEWHASNRPGVALIKEINRCIQTVHAKFCGGYLRVQRYELGT